MKKQRQESEFKTQLMRRAREVQGAPTYVRPVKVKQVKDPRMFDPDKFKGESILFPCLDFIAEKVGKVAATIALLCLSCFTANGQNVVTAQDVSKRFVEFTWYGDTITNADLRPFIASAGFADSTAVRVSTEVTKLLMLTRDVTNASIYMGNVLEGMTFEQYCKFYLGLKEDGR